MKQEYYVMSLVQQRNFGVNDMCVFKIQLGTTFQLAQNATFVLSADMGAGTRKHTVTFTLYNPKTFDGLHFVYYFADKNFTAAALRGSAKILARTVHEYLQKYSITTIFRSGMNLRPLPAAVEEVLKYLEKHNIKIEGSVVHAEANAVIASQGTEIIARN